MKSLRNIIILVLSVIAFPVSGQFWAEPASGCDSLEVTFHINPLLINPATVDSIYWEFGDGQDSIIYNTDPFIHLYRTPGQYRPRITINNNPPITVNSIIIKVYSSPDAFFNYYDTTVSGTFSIVFIHSGQADDTLSWSYSWILSDNTEANTSYLVHAFDTVGLYWAQLIMQNSMGCSDTVTRIFEVIDTLDIPNVFSPNEDNINDQWIVRSNGMTFYSLKIFARTGTLIYQAEARVITWDGRNQSGQEMAADTYFFIIEPVKSVKYPTKFKKAGFIQLYR